MDRRFASSEIRIHEILISQVPTDGTFDHKDDYELILRLIRQRDDAREQVKLLRDRLQIDPGGSDRIDELEEAIQYLRADLENLRNLADTSASEKG